jgi:hypothetical protein
MLEVGNGFREKVLLLKPLKERFGQAMLEAVQGAVARQTRTLWAELASREPDNRLETLVDLLWNRLCSPLGFELHCAQDPDITAGFNPAVGFRQTHWLMRGDDCCDHFYFRAQASITKSESEA